MAQARRLDHAGYTERSKSTRSAESEQMDELRSTIREAIARGLPLVLDRDRFLRRIVDVISESSGYPSIAIYVSALDGVQMTLGAASERAPLWLPSRIPVDVVPEPGPRMVDASQLFDLIDPDDERHAITAPFGGNGGTVGLLVIMDVDDAVISAGDLTALGVVAEEIAPAIGIAARHHEVEQTSVIDLPTGAYTYDFFLQRLDEELSRAQRTGHSVTIVLVEAWHFDEFERAAGYDVADRVLRDLAHGFAAVLRASDVVARRRRSGFALLLPESDIAGANVTVTRISERVQRVEQALREQGYSGRPPGIISGAATFPDDGSSSAALVLAADQRLQAQADDPADPPI